MTPDPTQHLFETEQVTFHVDGDTSAGYALRGAAGAAPTGAVGGLAYTARVLATGTATADDALELTATYAADHPVFVAPVNSTGTTCWPSSARTCARRSRSRSTS